MKVAVVVLALALVTAVSVAIEGRLGRGSAALAAEPVLPIALDASTTTAATATTSSISTTTTTQPLQPPPPAPGARYIVSPGEIEPEAKQLAADIAYSLTTYEAFDDHWARLNGLVSGSGVDDLARASSPLIYMRSWSRGEVINPQLGGLRNGRASVMVITRQTVGSGSESEFSVVRTLDIRLVRGESGWQFESLGSAGGVFFRVEDLALANAVAGDPRIEMPDSAPLDILSGLVSPVLLNLMAEIADRTPFGVTVLVTGHPHNVFETDRESDHTVGRAVDIYLIGDHRVIDDRGPDSATRNLVEWLYSHPAVRQVGSPWDIDAATSRRSFSDEVHQDHIHIAVNEGP